MFQKTETDVNSQTEHKNMLTQSEESTDEKIDDCMGDENDSFGKY